MRRPKNGVLFELRAAEAIRRIFSFRTSDFLSTTHGSYKSVTGPALLLVVLLLTVNASDPGIPALHPIVPPVLSRQGSSITLR